MRRQWHLGRHRASPRKQRRPRRGTEKNRCLQQVNGTREHRHRQPASRHDFPSIERTIQATATKGQTNPTARPPVEERAPPRTEAAELAGGERRGEGPPRLRAPNPTRTRLAVSMRQARSAPVREGTSMGRRPPSPTGEGRGGDGDIHHGPERGDPAKEAADPAKGGRRHR